MSRKKVKDGHDSSNSLKVFKIGEIANLSMLQIIILQILNQHHEPIVRHLLYQEVNSLIKLKEAYQPDTQQLFSESFFKQNLVKKYLSTSTFYSNLNMLEQQGLLAFNRNKKGKVDTVEATILTVSLLNFLNQYFILNLIDDYEFNVLTSKKISEKIRSANIKQEDSILSIFTHESTDLQLIDHLSKNYNKVYIISLDELKESLNKLDLKNLTFTRIHDGLIREPNNIFNLIVLQGYNENLKFCGLSFTEILKEAVRVIKQNGIIFVFARALLSKEGGRLVDRMITNKILALYNDSIFKNGKALTKAQLKNVLIEGGVEKLQIFEEQGFLIGIGEVHK